MRAGCPAPATGPERGTELALTLPDFPWDNLEAARERAMRHPDGLVDLSMGTPVDPTPDFIAAALSAASDAPGYPSARGTRALREAAAAWLLRRLGVTASAEDAILPTIGSKETVAWLPTLLGIERGTTIVIPELAYPTYEVGALLAGARVRRADEPPEDSDGVSLAWLNSPANPHGAVLTADELRRWVAWGRERSIPLVVDECYVELGWTQEPISVLHPSVVGDSAAGVLAVHSLSKRSNLAGYRAGLMVGDPDLVAMVWNLRRHTGLLVPAPVQAAMIVAYGDDRHVAEQRARYGARREQLAGALRAGGYRIDHSVAGLYLWVTGRATAMSTVDWFADRGILVAPGSFYGPAGASHVRIALTATDERVAAAADRIARSPHW